MIFQVILGGAVIESVQFAANCGTGGANSPVRPSGHSNVRIGFDSAVHEQFEVESEIVPFTNHHEILVFNFYHVNSFINSIRSVTLFDAEAIGNLRLYIDFYSSK